MNEIEDIKRLEKELKERKEKLQNKQDNCNHIWGDVKYDPEEVLQQYCTGEYEGKGVDKWPVTRYRKVNKDRWGRTCLKCGKVEYAYNKKPVKYELDFKY